VLTAFTDSCVTQQDATSKDYVHCGLPHHRQVVTSPEEVNTGNHLQYYAMSQPEDCNNVFCFLFFYYLHIFKHTVLVTQSWYVVTK
jgi:hypothetical protein